MTLHVSSYENCPIGTFNELKEVRYNVVPLKPNAHVDFNNIRYKTVKTPPMHDVDTVDDKYFHFSLYACLSLHATK